MYVVCNKKPPNLITRRRVVAKKSLLVQDGEPQLPPLEQETMGSNPLPVGVVE
jgi:hypothetical protein